MVEVHQPASLSIRCGLSINPGVKTCCVCGELEEMMCVVCMTVTKGT